METHRRSFIRTLLGVGVAALLMPLKAEAKTDRPYVVGERGPELVTPNGKNHIITVRVPSKYALGGRTSQPWKGVDLWRKDNSGVWNRL